MKTTVLIVLLAAGVLLGGWAVPVEAKVVFDAVRRTGPADGREHQV